MPKRAVPTRVALVLVQALTLMYLWQEAKRRWLVGRAPSPVWVAAEPPEAVVVRARCSRLRQLQMVVQAMVLHSVVTAPALVQSLTHCRRPDYCCCCCWLRRRWYEWYWMLQTQVLFPKRQRLPPEMTERKLVEMVISASLLVGRALVELELILDTVEWYRFLNL